MESFVVQFRKSKVSSHRRNVHSDGDQTLVSSVISRWPAPKTILIPKTEQGYGFTLRHFIFYPSSATAQQQNLEREQDDGNQGPSYKRKRLSFLDPMDTIFVKNVRTYSPAYDAGLKTGDRVITVNDQSVSQKSYAQVIGLIQQSEGTLKLEVLPKDETDGQEDPCQVAHRSPEQLHQAELCHNDEVDSPASNRKSPFRRFISSDELRERPRSLLAREEIAPKSEDRILLKSMDPQSKLKTSTSYTSGLSVFREPWNSAGNRQKESPSREFLERRQDFEVRAKENNGMPANKAYSYGLFYDKTKSVNDLSTAVPRRQEHVLHPTDSQENISKSNKSETRVIPLENRRSREMIQDKTGYGLSSSSRHSFPDSISGRHSASLSTGLQNTSNSKSEYHTSTRQYIPVVSAQPSAAHKMSASVDSLDSSSSYHTPDRNVRTRVYEQPNQGGGRTFIVKIGDRHYEGGVSQGNAQSDVSGNAVKQAPRYGTAFALTRSPMSSNGDQGRVVSQKKFMFENGKSDKTQSKSPVVQERYKTEIDKITSHGKFSSVATRVQSFEKEEPQPSSNIRIHRRSSQDRCVSMPPDSLGQSSHTSQQPYQEQAPIRIYVSQGSGNNPGSPIVEIVPMYPNSSNKTVTSSQEMSPQPIIHIKQSDDVDGAALSCHQEEDTGHPSKPVRKPSFLAAVNGSQQRLLPVTTADDLALPSSPIKDVKSTVVLRRKSETSPEDEAIKLQRRTSYLMATAKDRDSHKLSLDKTHSPSQSQTEIHLQITTPHQKPSMRKLKYFFGEKTPRIIEATERRQDPASPMQEVTKKGALLCKTDLTDGKKASDRSWKPVWVELRGHALYISKEKRDPANLGDRDANELPSSQPIKMSVTNRNLSKSIMIRFQTHTFNFDDQPISIKSCLVDIAHDYTKKKNVFRLKTFNGSEYLFQADENNTMLDWIRSIQSNNNPDADVSPTFL
eukprot:XP_011448377.1 PREDICTED: rho GTPase-activating protein 21-A isoform X7 [Crassostrea gigas]